MRDLLIKNRTQYPLDYFKERIYIMTGLMKTPPDKLAGWLKQSHDKTYKLEMIVTDIDENTRELLFLETTKENENE